MSGGAVTAREVGLAVCRVCHQLTDRPGAPCSNCGAPVFMRTPNSLQMVWALWLAGVVCYIPGNLLPIMVTQSLGNETASTIIGGVITLFEHKSYSVGAVVLIASLVVPIAKFLMIALIALSIQLNWPIDNHHRHTAHVVIEYVGRWSMVDVFVVAALSALIQLGGVVAINPGPGVGFFALSVALTMLSAQAIDPRLIWDEDTTNG
ncbi:MAG: paraquat-inducible protein A [Pseudomonadota bacterium]